MHSIQKRINISFTLTILVILVFGSILFRILIQTSHSLSLEYLHGQLNFTCALFGICLISFGIIAYFIYRSIANNVLKSITKIIVYIEKISQGRMDIEIDKCNVKEINLLIQALNSMILNTREKAHIVEQIAQGNLTVNIHIDSENDILSKSIKLVRETLRELVSEIKILTSAAIEGKIDVRGNANKFRGGYYEIIDGVNKTLDVLIEPVKETSQVLREISKGNLKVTVKGDYNGDYAEIKNNMNLTINTLSAYVEEISDILNELSKANLAVEIKKNYSGDFVRIKDSLEIMILNIKDQATTVEQIAHGNLNLKINEKSDNDVLSKSIKLVVETLQKLVYEMETLTNAAIEGNLDQRGNEDNFMGVYRKIISGVNNTLNAVIEPIKESSTVLQEMAKGNLQVWMVGNYKNDFGEIKKALNFTIGTISSYINEIADVLTKISNADLLLDIKGNYRGDFVQIEDSLNLIIKSLNDVLNEINITAERVASGAGQVSEYSQVISAGATTQACSIEELTAAITEISIQTKDNAFNAKSASEFALDAKQHAVEGNNQMNDMLNSMKEINKSSQNISKIIQVIDEIAFQTNILALNAAVEAARAGQYGKGFAVVAEEVRNLASRSANAAKETSEMIENAIRKVEVGTNIANDTSVALNRIVEDMSRVANLVENIASSSNEQALGLTQVNQSIEQVSKVTQTNSAISEDSATASEQLSNQAKLLKTMIGKFRLKNLNFQTNLDTDLNPEMINGFYEFDHRNSNTDSINKLNYTNITKPNHQFKDINTLLEDKEFGKY